jgi:peptide/nickel transport system substrate-binding protein
MQIRAPHLLAAVFASGLIAFPSPAQNELRFTLTADPKTFHPLLSDDDNSGTILALSAGYLIRTNRLTQNPEPDLASSWKVSPDRKSITFQLRPGVLFSDGTPFTSEDVAYTLRTVTDPNLHSPNGDAFPSSVKSQILSPGSITVSFPTPQTGVESLFNQLPILSGKSPLKEKAVLGPFVMADYHAGVEIVLKRNPHYWKKDSAGRQLPYLDAVRLYIQQNNEIRYARFQRKEIHLINNLEPAAFKRLAREAPAEAIDSGPSLDVDFLWFNQVASAPIPDYKRAWFQSRAFRLAISEAINRADICRIVYLGTATPALGPISPANRFWFDRTLKPQTFDPAAALKVLRDEGFQLQNNELHDKAGHLVEFSIVTNAGNKNREAMAALIQQDLKKIGVRLNIVTLEFRSLLERIAKTYNYEAALLGFVINDIDPNEQTNIWLSSSPQHAWNPNQKKPATPWEAEIDQLMRAQASAPDPARRKAAFDRVQQIVREQLPYIYLVNRNTLSAVSSSLKGVQPAKLFPETFWNIDQISFK